MILSTASTIRPTNYNQSYYKFKSAFVLNFEEKDFLSKVMDVSGKTYIGEAIQVAMQNFTIDGFRELVTTLLSQGDDNPEMMKRILGEDCYRSLQNLRP